MSGLGACALDPALAEAESLLGYAGRELMRLAGKHEVLGESLDALIAAADGVLAHSDRVDVGGEFGAACSALDEATAEARRVAEVAS